MRRQSRDTRIPSDIGSFTVAEPKKKDNGQHQEEIGTAKSNSHHLVNANDNKGDSQGEQEGVKKFHGIAKIRFFASSHGQVSNPLFQIHLAVF